MTHQTPDLYMEDHPHTRTILVRGKKTYSHRLSLKDMGGQWTRGLIDPKTQGTISAWQFQTDHRPRLNKWFDEGCPDTTKDTDSAWRTPVSNQSDTLVNNTSSTTASSQSHSQHVTPFNIAAIIDRLHQCENRIAELEKNAGNPSGLSSTVHETPSIQTGPQNSNRSSKKEYNTASTRHTKSTVSNSNTSHDNHSDDSEEDYVSPTPARRMISTRRRIAM